MRALAVLAVPLAGCWSVAYVDEVGPVRFVIRTSPLGICGASDSTLETASGRTLVDHAWNFSRQHSMSPDGTRMLVVGWVRDRLHRLYLVDLSALKVIWAVDLPESHPDESSAASLGPWSSDGRNALVESLAPDGEETRFSVVAVDGLRLTPVHREPHRHSARRAWSPDGASVAVVIGVGPKHSTAEGWKLVHMILGPPLAVREVSRIPSLPLNARIEWEGATPRVVP